MKLIERRIRSIMQRLGSVWCLLTDLAGIETQGIGGKQRERDGVGESVKTQTLIEREVEGILGTQVEFFSEI